LTNTSLQHNEPGIRRVSPIPSAAKLVDEFLSTITATKEADPERGFLDFKHDGKDEVILVVNNLGGLPELELSIVTKEAAEWLKAKRITVKRFVFVSFLPFPSLLRFSLWTDSFSSLRSAIAGSFVTSLSLPGFSLTLLLLPRSSVALPPSSAAPSSLSFDSNLLVELFDAPTEAPGWRWTFKGEPEMKVQGKQEEEGGKKTEKRETEVGSEVKGPKRAFSFPCSFWTVPSSFRLLFLLLTQRVFSPTHSRD